jgi:hypothetical protein
MRSVSARGNSDCMPVAIRCGAASVANVREIFGVETGQVLAVELAQPLLEGGSPWAVSR